MIRVYKKQENLKNLSSTPFVQQCLGDFLDEDPGSLAILRHPSGQPYIEYKIPVFFSLTHSTDLLSLACSLSYEIGLDLQFHRHFNLNIFKSICTPKEIHNLQDLNEENFFKVWTIKEAALKCLGLGLRFPMDQLQINFEHYEIQVLSDEAKFKKLNYAELSLFQNSTAHLVWNRQEKDPPIEVIQVTPGK
ncbi:MAG: 4'-phosphopantetheinyl transferase family protein [Pseudobdellovibrionaceae bacterium]